MTKKKIFKNDKNEKKVHFLFFNLFQHENIRTDYWEITVLRMNRNFKRHQKISFLTPFSIIFRYFSKIGTKIFKNGATRKLGLSS